MSKHSDYVMVPREPTPEMIIAGDEANPTTWNDGTDHGFISDVSNDIYRAMLSAAPDPKSDPVAEVVAGPPFEFDRYVNGNLMAEGVCIEREVHLEEAMRVAARIASRGRNGETPVLVYRPPPQPAGADYKTLYGKEMQRTTALTLEVNRLQKLVDAKPNNGTWKMTTDAGNVR